MSTSTTCGSNWVPAPAQLGDGLGMGHRLTIRAVGRHRVVGVAREDDARADGDRVAGDAVGIPPAVPALVLVADDPGHAAQPRDGAQDALADDRVVLHELPLVLAELPGLLRMSSEMATLPMSCSSAAALTRSTSSSSSPRPLATPSTSLTHLLGVVARVAVALAQGHGERGHGVAALALLGRDVVGLLPGRDAMAAQLARVVQRHVGGAQGRLGRGGAVVGLDSTGHADALHRPGRSRLQRVEHALAARHGAREVGLGHQDDELVAGAAAGDVVDAGLGDEHVGHGPQDLVAGRVTVLGADRTEAVDVQHGDGEGAGVAPRAGGLDVELVAEAVERAQAGDGIALAAARSSASSSWMRDRACESSSSSC